MVYVLEHNTLKSKQYFLFFERGVQEREGERRRERERGKEGGVCVFMWEESYAFPFQFKERLSELWIKCHSAASHTHTHTA